MEGEKREREWKTECRKVWEEEYVKITANLVVGTALGAIAPRQTFRKLFMGNISVTQCMSLS